MVKYIQVEWPEYQYYMNHSRWDECIFVDSSESTSSSYMIPEDIYNEVFNSTQDYE